MLQHIVPRLRDAGVAQAKIDAMLIDNPRRYFAEAGTHRLLTRLTAAGW